MPNNNVGKIVGIAAAIIGGICLLVCCGCGGMFMWLASTPGPSSASASQPFDVANVPVPPMPERLDPFEVEPGVTLYQMEFAGSGPGGAGQIWLYLPTGEHAPGSLPCVLVAPAGSTLLDGMELGDGDMAEHLPYVHAGFAVVAYSLDGSMSYQSQDAAYSQFRDAMGGVVNGRNAMEFVIARVPEVDPNRVFSAGHSSAGTLSLLLAEHEPRLRGAAAYMPAYDVPARLGPLLRVFSMGLPDATDFAHQSSPKTHADRLNCPVFLYTAEDDSNVPAADVKAAAEDLKSRGKDVTIDSAPYGDHYQPMIDTGIPAAIAWMKTKGA